MNMHMNTHMDTPLGMAVHSLAKMKYASNISEWIATGNIERIADPLVTIENNSLYLGEDLIATIDTKNRIMYVGDPHNVKDIARIIKGVALSEKYSVAKIIGVGDNTLIDVTDMKVISKLFLNRLINIVQILHDCYFLDEWFLDAYVTYRQLHDSINKLPIVIKDLFPTLKHAMDSWVTGMTEDANSFITKGAEPSINLSAYRIDHNGVVERANAPVDSSKTSAEELRRVIRLSKLANRKGRSIKLSDSSFIIDNYGNVQDGEYGEYGLIPYEFIQLIGLQGE